MHDKSITCSVSVTTAIQLTSCCANWLVLFIKRCIVVWCLFGSWRNGNGFCGNATQDSCVASVYKNGWIVWRYSDCSSAKCHYKIDWQPASLFIGHYTRGPLMLVHCAPGKLSLSFRFVLTCYEKQKAIFNLVSTRPQGWRNFSLIWGLCTLTVNNSAPFSV